MGSKKPAKTSDQHRQTYLVVVVGLLIVVLLLGLLLGFYISNSQKVEGNVKAGTNSVEAAAKPSIKEPVVEFIKVNEGSTFVTVAVPAVDDQGNGVVTKLEVQVSAGSGRVLTNIDKLFFWIDTQNSIRKATKVAQDITHKDLSKYDIVYTVKANASVIEGGSAGAALAIGTIAAFGNKTMDNKIMITGTIDDDGKIGPVGEVVAKAIGAKEAGATTFLVPTGQGSSKIYKPEKRCYSEGPIQICETKTTSEKIFISKDVGIEVREVSNIREALQYFFAS